MRLAFGLLRSLVLPSRYNGEGGRNGVERIGNREGRKEREGKDVKR